MQSVEFKVSNTNGLTNVLFARRVRFRTVDFFLRYNRQFISSEKEAKFREWRRDQGKDDLGPYIEAVSSYSASSGKESFTIEKICRSYQEEPIVLFRLKNSCKRPLFPEEDLGGITVGEVVGLRAALYSYHDNPFWTVNSFPKGVRELPDWGNFLLLEYTDGVVAAVIPVNSYHLRAKLASQKGRFSAIASSFNKNKTYDLILCCLVVFGDDPYQVVDKAYDAAIVVMNYPTKKRSRKLYPEVFEYLGWCSWNAFGRAVSEKDILSTAELIKRRGLPIKFFLIDDGWMENWDKQKGEKLKSFRPDPKKFSRAEEGFKPLVEDLKKRYGIKYVGLWHTLQGYWRGIEPGSELAEKLQYTLLKSEEGYLFPNPKRSSNFFSDWYMLLQEWGIDFVKVDDQSSVRRFARNRFAANEAAGETIFRLQSAAELYLKGLINCMGMSLECVYHWIDSNVSRASDDYAPGDKDRAKRHIMDSVYNSLWFSQFTWPDYDMFQSHDPYARAHALSRAISGGPIYLTDNVEKSDLDLISRLCFRDGRILRPDLPALPTRDCLFIDPYNKPTALKAFTRCGEVGLVMAVNVNKDGLEEEVRVRPGDAGIDPDDRCAIYCYFEDELDVVSDNRPLGKKLGELDCELFIISPVKEGFAPIGLINKFIAPKGIISVEREDKIIRVKLREEGSFLAFLEAQEVEVRVNGERCKRVEETLEANSFSFKDGILRIKADGKDVWIRYS